MVEFICMSCNKYFEVAEGTQPPTQCPHCAGKDITLVTFIKGPSMAGVSITLGILSLLLGPYLGLPAVMLGLMAITAGKPHKGKAIIGSIAGAVGTIGISFLVAWGFMHFYNASYTARCELNLSRIALGEVKNPSPMTTTCPSTMPADYTAGAAATTQPTTAAATSPTTTSSPASTPTIAPVYYKTTWPWTLDELVKKCRQAANSCPKSGQSYFYVPPTTTAPANAIVLADVQDTHPGRCVMRVDGSVDCLTEEQFTEEMKNPDNALFAYMLAESQKPKEEQKQDEKKAEPASQPVSQPVTQPASRPTTAPKSPGK